MHQKIKKILKICLTKFGYIYSIKTASNEKVLYLTFDDGPNIEYTKQTLNVLNKYNALATFFLIGESISGSEEIVREIIANNHGVGNHSYTHKNYVNCTFREMVSEIENTDGLLRNYISLNSFLLRPPYGKFRFKYLSDVDVFQ